LLPGFCGLFLKGIQDTVDEGLVFRVEDYMSNSATNYAGNKRLLDIFII